ncbi:HAMP domain-containing sensor histidine kinase [Cytobacillus gottheilii]|uniref:HAMP domain-containing sensor histidine kinase n=1 Tax=Cytobacillus gottheilii TaxID=859144 RepID=UPI003CFB82A8
MFTKNHKRVSLLRYWTTRYLITLCIGLIVIAIISAVWIRHTTLENRLKIMTLMSEEVADRFIDISEGRPMQNGDVPGLLSERGRYMDLEKDPYMYIVDVNGRILTSNRSNDRIFARFPGAILTNEEQVQKLQLTDSGEDFYIVKTPIQSEAISYGWVVFIELEDNLTEVDQEYTLLGVMIISLALLGWAAIYFLSRRLSNPIKDVAFAAKQVKEGDYNIHLPSNINEQEVYELVHSFQEMSARLQKLESLRTELLAGVTHELKTPVTSISGLLQAINDDVVTGEDAKEFLTLSLKETAKMKKMVEDLLAFNTFAANSIPVVKEEYHINELIREFTHDWEVVQEDHRVTLTKEYLSEDAVVSVDKIRLQQVLTNLLNNARQAIEDHGQIRVSIKEEQNNVHINIQDTGSGIPPEEQKLIFERFYRGEGKKYKVRGLGLGLPFSKMIANALGGDLELTESSPAGTTFTITLPKYTVLNEGQ